MNIVVIDGCPQTNKNSTSLVLTPFLDGMREAGAQVTL
jgi:multimeric flavodoxin WrbA